MKMNHFLDTVSDTKDERSLGLKDLFIMKKTLSKTMFAYGFNIFIANTVSCTLG